jgi:flagellar protein FliS
MNGYANAQSAYTESAVMTASPERLVLMLYDGAIRFLRQSVAAFRGNDINRGRERLRKAEAIIDELNFSLDMTHGEVPERLRAIYLFCKRHLLEARIANDADSMERVIALLADLRESWAILATKATANTAA